MICTSYIKKKTIRSTCVSMVVHSVYTYYQKIGLAALQGHFYQGHNHRLQPLCFYHLFRRKSLNVDILIHCLPDQLELDKERF